MRRALILVLASAAMAKDPPQQCTTALGCLAAGEFNKAVTIGATQAARTLSKDRYGPFAKLTGAVVSKANEALETSAKPNDGTCVEDPELTEAVALALDGSKDTRGTHHLTTEYNSGRLIIEPLQDKSKLEALIKNHEHVKDLALDTLKLHDKTVARCGDGRLTSYSFSVKGRGWEVTNKPDSPSMKPVSVYAITFHPKSATSFDDVINDDNEKTNQRVQRVLIRFREHCRAGKVKMIECFLNYIGMTHKTSTYERFHGARGHRSGQSGAGVLGAFLKEPLISKHFVMYHRCLATPKTPTEAYQLEAVVGNLVFVGGIFGLNQAHMGPWRYTGENGRPSTVIFLGWCVNRGKGGLSVAEILSASQRRALFVIESTTSWE